MPTGSKPEKTENGEIVLYHDQDESRWNYELIAKGAYSSSPVSYANEISKYPPKLPLRIGIHRKADTKEKWENILHLYNLLYNLEYSPIAALNRHNKKLKKVRGKREAIVQAEKLQLTVNHFYYTLLGELYTGIDNEKALQNFQKAFELAKTVTDKRTIQKKIKCF